MVVLMLSRILLSPDWPETEPDAEESHELDFRVSSGQYTSNKRTPGSAGVPEPRQNLPPAAAAGGTPPTRDF